jgi:hypothetical protein
MYLSFFLKKRQENKSGSVKYLQFSSYTSIVTDNDGGDDDDE